MSSLMHTDIKQERNVENLNSRRNSETKIKCFPHRSFDGGRKINSTEHDALKIK